jgi:LacI family transcriptional regulator
VQQRHRATLQDIADALELSANTVSRALSDKGGVSERTRSLIRAEAERIGYIPNVHARSLVLGSRMMIGLVITNPSNPFYAELISEIEFHAAAAGYTLVLLLSEESVEREENAADTLMRSGVDAAIVVPVQGRVHPWGRLERAGIPLVVVNRNLEGLHSGFVGTDNEAGTYAATTHVIEQGATSVMLLEEDLPITTIRQRIEGFRRSMTDAGLELTERSVVAVPTRRNNRVALPWQADEAYRLATDLMNRGHRPDAYVVGNDYFALGLFRALREHGLEVPNDTMVVGFGDYPFSEFLMPSLSTVRLPARSVGRRAVELILDRLGGAPNRGFDSVTIAPELVIRESTRRGLVGS